MEGQPSTELVPLPESTVDSTVATGRWYQGRRRQRTGVVGWLRGLGTVPWLLVGAVTVALLTALGWWAGGRTPGAPQPPAPFPAAPAVSAMGPTAASASPSPSATARRTPSATPSRSPVPPAPPVPPSPPAPGRQSPTPSRTRYEAEVASIGNGTPAHDHPGYSGTGFVDFASAVGSFVQWRVTVPVAGPVTLVIGYSNGSLDSRSCDVTVNGAMAQRGLTFPSTRDWGRWSTRTLTVVLPAGASEIRVTATTPAGGPDIDYLDVQT